MLTAGVGVVARFDVLLCIAPGGDARLLDAVEELSLGLCPAGAGDDELGGFLGILSEAAGRSLPDGQRLSGELGRWIDLAGGKLGRSLKWARGDFQRLTRHLLLGLKVLTSPARRDRAEGFAALGLRASARSGGGVRLAWSPPPAPELVDLLLTASYDFSPAGAGGFAPLERRALGRRLRELDAAVAGVLEGVERLAAAKFRAPIQLGALMPTQGEPVSWRLALTDPLRVGEGIESEDFYVFRPMDLDLGECGVGRALEAVEKLALHGMEQRKGLKRAGGRQLDMVESALEGPGEASALEDPFNWLCGRALRLRVPESQRESMAYLVASHVMDLRARAPFRDCPEMPLVSLPELFAD